MVFRSLIRVIITLISPTLHFSGLWNLGVCSWVNLKIFKTIAEYKGQISMVRRDILFQMKRGFCSLTPTNFPILQINGVSYNAT